jgi:hypothetical protein
MNSVLTSYIRSISSKILWDADPLLGNDREISNYTTAVTRQRLVNSNRGMRISVLSLPRYFKQDKSVSELVGVLLS